VWAVLEASRIDKKTAVALGAPENRVLVSAVTPWEITIKQAVGRLSFPLELFPEMIENLGFEVLPILPSHAIAIGALPRHHNDPFDRMLIAQALMEGLTLVSSDRAIARYAVPLFGQG
jgi:PIN domain nuclease of toxin-antitoxin system